MDTFPTGLSWFECWKPHGEGLKKGLIHHPPQHLPWMHLPWTAPWPPPATESPAADRGVNILRLLTMQMKRHLLEPKMANAENLVLLTPAQDQCGVKNYLLLAKPKRFWSFMLLKI